MPRKIARKKKASQEVTPQIEEQIIVDTNTSAIALEYPKRKNG